MDRADFAAMAELNAAILIRLHKVARSKGIDSSARGTYYSAEVEAIRTRISFYTMLAEETTDERQERLRQATP